MFALAAEEQEILELLGEAWNKFAALPQEHPSEGIEFAQAIHRCQDMMAARPVWRLNRWKRAQRN
ncbi:MAG TPA: hypothetical protein VJ253_05775 [Dehalococcoidia bacterium]|nr:hypothetical protein [Dehalococcoidia bacterium]